MLERVYYRCGMALVCALALLIVLMLSPLLPSGTRSKSVQMICPMQNYSTPPTPSTRHCFKSTADGNVADTTEFGREVENENEEECFVGVPGSVSFLIGPPLPTSLKRPAKQTKAFGRMQSSPVLRC
jgi:hypothetical protein